MLTRAHEKMSQFLHIVQTQTQEHVLRASELSNICSETFCLPCFDFVLFVGQELKLDVRIGRGGCLSFSICLQLTDV